MNDTPDPGPGSALLTRRTVAKTAAWAAPAIALAAASPAYATSTAGAMIVLDPDAYEVSPNGSVTITGMLIPAEGDSIPTDIGLMSALSEGSGFNAHSLVVTGDTFSLKVTAKPGATESKLRVWSWNHSEYAEAFATLSLADVQAGSGDIAFDYPLYVLARGGEVELSGVVMSADGMPVPDDIDLVADVLGVGYTLTQPPQLTGDRFTMKVKDASLTAAAGGVSVYSTKYPLYSAATTQLTVNAPGFVEAGYGMLPIANTWVASTEATAGRDKAVRWFRPAAATPLTVSSAMLGSRWLDLRVSLQNNSTFTDNFKTAPFQQPEWTGAFPGNFPGLDLRTEAAVVSLSVNGVAQEVSRGIGMGLGRSTITGPGTLTGSADPVVTFWPNRDSSGAATANNAVYAFLPAGLPKGSVGRVEIVTTVTRRDNGRATKIGFVIDYRYP